jgi:hypothetical protein
MTQTDIYIFNFLIISFSLYNWIICTMTFFLDYNQNKFAGKYSKWTLNNFFQF